MSEEKIREQSQFFGDEFTRLEYARNKLREATKKKDYPEMYERLKDVRVAYSFISILMAGNDRKCSEIEHLLMKLTIGKKMKEGKFLLDGISQDCAHVCIIADEFLRRAHNTLEVDGS